MKRLALRAFMGAVAVLMLFVSLREAVAFCGFYVAQADSQLFNESSKVVLVRDGDRTVLTMSNDFRGDPTEFAVVIPVPTILKKEQIHIGNAALIDHLDSYSAPRLVEYYDENPCEQKRYEALSARMPMAPAGAGNDAAAELGVKVEAEYTIGEYDIVILSAQESDGLETWLKGNGYRIPSGATTVLGSYIKQKLHFFVAKVNLKEKAKLGFSYLRPIQVAYESPKFMLPIRLGTVNSAGTQDLFVFAITRKGRVETTNYRTVKLPEGLEVPLYVKGEFPAFYKALFAKQYEANGRNSVFLEYAWDMGWCDPCAAQPLSKSELKELGVFWLEERETLPRGFVPQGVDAFLTRLHVRYDGERFPEDLMFQETSDKTNFQGRYVLRHRWSGSDSCPAADEYRKGLPKLLEQEAKNLSELTGEDLSSVREKMKLSGPPPHGDDEWWKKIWG